MADDRAMPEGSPYYQLVAGELIKAPSPSIFHQEVVGNIYLLLANHVRKHRLGKVRIASLDVYLSETSVVQPDVFFLANASLPLIQSDGVHGAPDLVIEIVSPSDGWSDKKRKRPIYAQCGEKELWLVDPVMELIHRDDFMIDVAKAVRIVDSEESFETLLVPGLKINAIEVFQR